jgi:hypothetical protein
MSHTSFKNKSYFSNIKSFTEIFYGTNCTIILSEQIANCEEIVSLEREAAKDRYFIKEF